jgi:hypothetical protein
MRRGVRSMIFLLPVLLVAQLDGKPSFPEILNHDESSYVKTNSSSVKAFGFIKLLTACLYVGEGYEIADYPGFIPLALNFRYDRNFRKEQLIRSADEILGELYTSKQLEEIDEQLKSINSTYLDVQKGDEYTLIYQPVRGTTLLYNGKEKVTIPGERFAEIYFSIWLGDHPKIKKLSRELLKQSL